MASKKKAVAEETLELSPEEIAANEAKSEADAKRKEAAKKSRAEISAAKNTIAKFIASESPEYKALPEDVQTAMKRLGVITRSGGTNTMNGELAEIFPEDGATITEMDLFMLKKWGRSETRRKVGYALKNCEKTERLWIDFDVETETWTRVGSGAVAPAAWKGYDPDEAARKAAEKKSS